MSTLFISHSSKDNKVSKKLEQILQTKDHESVFLDLDPEKGIVAGTNWERTLYTKRRACQMEKMESGDKRAYLFNTFISLDIGTLARQLYQRNCPFDVHEAIIKRFANEIGEHGLVSPRTDHQTSI